VARVRMLDTTRSSEYGEMREGTVHEVSDEDAARFKRMGIAAATTAKTTAELNAFAAEPAVEPAEPADEARLPDEMPAPLNTPSVGRGDVAGLTGEGQVRGGRGR
jgi:hypothetical protein